ncbi:putative phage tail protein [Vibrio phage 496E54-1]|nr:putative phage tail protein [Vibrio phage 495E54-1]CAH9013175.1 putative phage tail protein [Vibrio phage 496E54-1]
MAATQPTNPLVRIAELDTTLPGAGTPNKIIPVTSLLQQGYDKENKMFAQNINYIFDNIAQWVKYSQDRLNEVDNTIAQLEQKHNQDIATLESQIEKERVSVGEIIEITGDNTNPSILKGYGTWESFGAGRVIVGAGTYTDDRGESKTWGDGTQQGEYNHVQTVEELATHKHNTDEKEVSHSHNYSITSSFAGAQGGSGADLPYSKDIPAIGTSTAGVTGGLEGPAISISLTNTSAATSVHTHTHTVEVLNNGESLPMNNIQPSLAVYRWKRTA